MFLPLFSHGQLVGKKDSQLDVATSLSGTDKVRILQGGVSKMAPYTLFGGGSSIVTDPAIASTGTVPLTFDAIRYFQKTTQTGNITLSLAASGHLNGRTQVIDINGNSTNTLTFPTTWDNGNGVTFDNTKNNQIYLDYVNGTVTYNIKKGAIPAGPDITAPVISSAATNSAGTIITLTYNEALGSVTPATTDFVTSPSKTISTVSVAGSTVLVTVSPAFVTGNTITINYTSGSNKIQDVAGNFAANLAGYSVTNNAGDVTAPTLSSPTATQTGATTATLGVTTNEANGTLYGVITTSATPPTATQVELGQNNAGTSASYAGNQTITTTGAKTFSATGLTASTVYYSYFMHKDAAANRSTVSAATSITTSAALSTVADNFNRANSTTSLGTASDGGTWTVTNGTFGITSNAAYAASGITSGTPGTAIRDLTRTAQDVTFDITNPNLTATLGLAPRLIFIIVRYVDAANYCWAQLYFDQGGSEASLALYSKVAGTDTPIGSTYNQLAINTAQTIRVTVNNSNQYVLYFNGTSVITGTSSANSSGTKVGLQLWNMNAAAYSSTTLDNFLAQ